MRLLLHIGMPKTGTSILQATLHANRRPLRAVGVLYPDPGHRKSNHNLVVAPLFGADDMPREFRQGRLSASRAPAWGRRLWETVRREMAAADVTTTILSGEYLYGLRDDRVARLAEILTEVPATVEVICYVRDPASYYVSLMQQVVRGSGRIQPPARFRMRTHECLPRWAAAVGRRPTVRAFQPTALVDGDVVADFVSTFVPEAGPALAVSPVHDANPSISAEAMCVLQDRHRDHGGAERLTRSRERIVARLRELESEVPQTRPRLRPDIEAALVGRHTEELRRLHDDYGIRFDDLADPAAPGAPTPPGWDADDLRSILIVDDDRVAALEDALRRTRPTHRRLGRRP